MAGFHLKAGNHIKANNAIYFNLEAFDNWDNVGIPIGFDIADIMLPNQDPRNPSSPNVESDDMGIFGGYPRNSRVYFRLSGSEYLRLSRSIKLNKEYYKKVFNSLLKNVNKNSHISLYTDFAYYGNPGDQDLLSEGIIPNLLREIGYENVIVEPRESYTASIVIR